MSELQATYAVNVGPGKSVEMTGDIDTLDKITMQMRTHKGLFEACQMALKDYQTITCPTVEHKCIMSRLRAAIGSVGE